LPLKQAFEFFAMTKPKKRIEINAKPKPLTDLREAEINLPNLPAGPEESSNVSGSLWKLGRVVLRRESAHRGGRTVIVIDDFATHLPTSVIEKTAKKIRLACGCGGTVKDRAIEIQGISLARFGLSSRPKGSWLLGLSRGEFPVVEDVLQATASPPTPDFPRNAM
jgi:translation initiation factor 1